MDNKMIIKPLTKKDFPPLLTEINDPPERLYIKGELPDWNQKFLAVVGSRKYTNYGREVCESLIEGLTGFPITIVSGLALGIDGIAHRSALKAGLKTIAVPGSGLDEKVLYPSSHRTLAKSIVEAGGCLLSEFEPNFGATTWSFPRRNRIMAGMSHAVLVIEAEEKSGTLITSKLATEYNREVLTVPGSIFSSASKGPHMLIRLGATPIRNSEDILEVFGMKNETTARDNALRYADCSKEELDVIKLLDSPQERDFLAENLDISTSELSSILSLLEIKGLIKESGGEIHLTN